jgi:hypothetical protein
LHTGRLGSYEARKLGGQKAGKLSSREVGKLKCWKAYFSASQPPSFLSS